MKINWLSLEEEFSGFWNRRLGLAVLFKPSVGEWSNCSTGPAFCREDFLYASGTLWSARQKFKWKAVADGRGILIKFASPAKIRVKWEGGEFFVNALRVKEKEWVGKAHEIYLGKYGYNPADEKKVYETVFESIEDNFLPVLTSVFWNMSYSKYLGLLPTCEKGVNLKLSEKLSLNKRRPFLDVLSLSVASLLFSEKFPQLSFEFLKNIFKLQFESGFIPAFILNGYVEEQRTVFPFFVFSIEKLLKKFQESINFIFRRLERYMLWFREARQHPKKPMLFSWAAPEESLFAAVPFWSQIPFNKVFGIYDAVFPDSSAIYARAALLLSKMASTLRLQKEANFWYQEARETIKRINEFLWEEKESIYSVRILADGTNEPIALKSAMLFFPLIVKAAEGKRLRGILKVLETEFMTRVPVPYLSKLFTQNSSMRPGYGAVDPLVTYIVLAGLKNYDQNLCRKISGRIRTVVTRHWRAGQIPALLDSKGRLSPGGITLFGGVFHYIAGGLI